VVISWSSLLPAHQRTKQSKVTTVNDPKHTSRRSREFFEEKGINWWRTPPENPDANQIENLWHELKVCKLLFFY